MYRSLVYYIKKGNTKQIPVVSTAIIQLPGHFFRIVTPRPSFSCPFALSLSTPGYIVIIAQQTQRPQKEEEPVSSLGLGVFAVSLGARDLITVTIAIFAEFTINGRSDDQYRSYDSRNSHRFLQ